MQRGLISSAYLHPEKIINSSLMQQLSAFMELLKRWRSEEAGMEGDAGVNGDAACGMCGLFPRASIWQSGPQHAVVPCAHPGRNQVQRDGLALSPARWSKRRPLSANNPSFEQWGTCWLCLLWYGGNPQSGPTTCRDSISWYKRQ